MSSSYGYLIPNKSFEVGQFKERVISILEEEKIIDGFYEEEFQWFASGENANSIFFNNEINSTFEYVEIHDTPNHRIIPDCTSENYEGKCNSCKNNLDEILSEKLMEVADLESENGIEIDITQLTVDCESCNKTNKIFEIDFDTPVRFSNQFICFVEIDNDFDKERTKEIALKLNCELEILYGRL
jgi:hypothetical protein